MKIIIRADSEFSCPAFYSLAKKHNLFYTIGIASNESLKSRSKRAAKAVELLYVQNNTKHQYFFSFPYDTPTNNYCQLVAR